jgi:hypothetical protein
VSVRELNSRIHAKSHIGELRSFLPEKYSSLGANGDGPQSVYLAEVGRTLAAALFTSIGGEASKVAGVAKEIDRAEQLSPSPEPDLEQWEDRVEVDIARTPRSLIPSANPSSRRAWAGTISRQLAGTRARVSGDEAGAARWRERGCCRCLYLMPC